MEEQTTLNRKTASRLLLINWSRFQREIIRLEGSTLITGINGSGKSTILDAMTFLLTGNTKFNTAAKDRDRSVLAYVRGDTRSNGDSRYLRGKDKAVISYIVMEFWSPVDEQYQLCGVVMESPNCTECKMQNWFVIRDARLEDANFCEIKDGNLYVTPKNELHVHGKLIKASEFKRKEEGTSQLLRTLGLRSDVHTYRQKILKMMAFNPENNIDKFIQDCVFDAGNIQSLANLKEQRQKFEEIKALYERLSQGKKKLEELEKVVREYEEKLRRYNVRRMMFRYQDTVAISEQQEESIRRAEFLRKQLKDLEAKYEIALRDYNAANERLTICRSNQDFQNMQSQLSGLEHQIENMSRDITDLEKDIATLTKLEEQIVALLNWALPELNEEDRRVGTAFSDPEIAADRKLSAFFSLKTQLNAEKEKISEDLVHVGDAVKALQDEKIELAKTIRQLENNVMTYPKEAEAAKAEIKKAFAEDGIDTDVRFLAELVSEVKEPKWRRAIETFLGRKRFFIIVDGKYCHRAMEVLHSSRNYSATVVITDKLPDTEAQEGSAAGILTVPNVYARRYVNYLLNGIHICKDLEELHNYPKGGLMEDGGLAKSYAFSNMDIRKTKIYFGQDAVKLQLKEAKKQEEQLREELSRKEEELKLLKEHKDELEKLDLNEDHYKMNAPLLHAEQSVKKRELEKALSDLKNNPDFVAILQEQEAAQAAVKTADSIRQKAEQDIIVNKNETAHEEKNHFELSGKLKVAENQYLELEREHFELKKEMLSEYEKLRERNGRSIVVTEKRLNELRNEVENNLVKNMEDIQISYCRIAGGDMNRRGPAFIVYYRGLYQDLANVEIERASESLHEQAGKLESAFMNDFVAEIREKIAAAREEMDNINRELRKIPFGNDTYKFLMKEKPDRQVFFRISDKLNAYMDNPEVYMNSLRNDEEMERDIKEFMDLILDSEDESLYTDYRNYFTYDMEITSRQGKEEMQAELSKKQGSASNGEKQTPYFIILAASLLQCYPKDKCCMRLGFIDEAFSALSKERIEKMVQYFEENNFQIIYAAPPEKIASIGSYIHSTVSLVESGRYTHVVEGLVKVS